MMNYDHRTLMGRWGRFIAYCFGLEHGSVKDYNEARVSFGYKKLPRDWIVSDMLRAIRRLIIRVIV